MFEALIGIMIVLSIAGNYMGFDGMAVTGEIAGGITKAVGISSFVSNVERGNNPVGHGEILNTTSEVTLPEQSKRLPVGTKYRKDPRKEQR